LFAVRFCTDDTLDLHEFSCVASFLMGQASRPLIDLDALRRKFSWLDTEHKAKVDKHGQ
jgi:hypothetical protein